MNALDKPGSQWFARWWAVALLGANTFIVGCGGGDSRDFAERAQLRMQAMVYRTSSNIIMIGSPLPCEEVITPFVVRAGTQGFPAGLRVDRVLLTRGGVPSWEQAPASAETRMLTKWLDEADWLSSPGSIDGNAPPGTHSEVVVQGVARGCVTTPIADGEALGVELQVSAGPEQASIKGLAAMQSVY